MSQGPLCPNLTKKVEKEVSQMANYNLSRVILLGGLSLHFKPPKNYSINHKSETVQPKIKEGQEGVKEEL